MIPSDYNAVVVIGSDGVIRRFRDIAEALHSGLVVDDDVVIRGADMLEFSVMPAQLRRLDLGIDAVLARPLRLGRTVIWSSLLSRAKNAPRRDGRVGRIPKPEVAVTHLDNIGAGVIRVLQPAQMKHPRFDRRKMYRDGTTVADFVVLGGTAGDLRLDLSRGIIRIEGPGWDLGGFEDAERRRHDSAPQGVVGSGMSAYRLGAQSQKRLEGVHPDLVAVVRRAIELTEQDFMVLEGVRTKEKMWANWGKGRSVDDCIAHGVPAQYADPDAGKVTWLKNPLNSKHAIQADGFGHAVDLVPYPVDWNTPSKFDEIAKAMFAASQELGFYQRVTWGADWDQDGNPRERGEADSPHWQISHF